MSDNTADTFNRHGGGVYLNGATFDGVSCGLDEGANVFDDTPDDCQSYGPQIATVASR